MGKHRLLAVVFVLAGVSGLLYLVTGARFRPPGKMECVIAESGVIPETASPFPAVSKVDWSQGPENARVTIIEYADLQCPHCAELELALAQLRADYPNDLRLVYRHFPLASLHDKAILSARAVEAAGLQGQFWPMHDRLLAQQDLWAGLSADQFRLYLSEEAGELGLDRERLNTDLDSQQIITTVDQAYESAVKMGLTRTPSLAINGQYYEGPLDAWTLAAYIELIKLEDRQLHECPPMLIDESKQYKATLHTTQGDIVIRLLRKQAPLAVNNFLYLSRQGWYDGVPFYRVIPEFATQTGDPSGTGLGGPGYTFKDEIDPAIRFDRAGIVAMAGSGADQNGSQFFITYGAQPTLDGKHTIFGQVVSGMDIAKKLAVRDPATNPVGMPAPDKILSVDIAEE